MRNFYYVNTGHRVGLDRFRRASAIIEHLRDEDITLLTNDFRIAGVAKEYFFKKGVGIDVIRNIPNMAVRGDKLIFDSAEHSDIIMEDMKAFFSTLIPFVDEIEGDKTHAVYANAENFAIASTFEEEVEKKDKVLLFFGDDDYEKDLLSLAKSSELQDVDCLLGYYFFLESEEELQPYFKKIIEEDEYAASIKEASLLITSSYQATLEASLSGSAVVYMQRVDYTQAYSDILRSVGIKVISMQSISKNDIEIWKREVKPVEVRNSAKRIADIIRQSLQSK